MRHLIAAAALALIAGGSALAQAPAQQGQPAPVIDQRAIDAARALSAFQRGQTMQRNAAERLCSLGQADYCQAASANPGQPTTAQGGTTANPPNTTGNQGAPARR